MIHVRRSIVAGAGLGALLAVVFTLLVLFQIDPEETPRRDVITVGLLIGVPASAAVGAIAAWVWELFFRVKR